MTDRSKLLALAEAVEKLTGPDREVDAEIARTVYADNCRNPDWECGPMLAYTASLDAAMTLATGYILLHLSDIGADGLPLCRIGDGTLAPPVGEWVGIASDLPRSVVAACLRARAQAEALA